MFTNAVNRSDTVIEMSARTTDHHTNPDSLAKKGGRASAVARTPGTVRVRFCRIKKCRG